MSTTIHDQLKDYYGKVLSQSSDLQTNACCCDAEAMPASVKAILGRIHPEITERFYGCGSPIPPLLEGMTVLDLGCGTGRDAYLLSGLVGEAGRVIGVDMTDEQLAIARKHVDHHAEAFGHARSNVEFRQGFIEDLGEIGIADDSVDIVVSNCVINLSPDKPQVWREIARVLKPGGKMVLVSFGFGTHWFNRFWYWLARVFPALLTNCRPVRMNQTVSLAGFHNLQVEYISQNTFPSDIVVAEK